MRLLISFKGKSFSCNYLLYLSQCNSTNIKLKAIHLDPKLALILNAFMTEVFGLVTYVELFK